MHSDQPSWSPGQADQVLILSNPKAGARSSQEDVERLVHLLKGHGLAANVFTDLGELEARAGEHLQAKRLRAVVPVGGDGTVAAAVNHTPPGTPIAVFPHGTENLLSKYIGVTRDAQQVCDLITKGHPVTLDAGEADGRIFLLMASVGLDADVVHRLHRRRRGHIGHLSYAKPLLESLRSYRYPRLSINYRVEAEDGSTAETEFDAAWAFVMNIPKYAGGLPIVPDADASDGLLDLCTFRQGSMWSGLMYLGGVLLRRHQSWQDCHLARVQSIRISSNAEAPYQLDGDPGGHLPLTINVLPGRLTLLVQSSWQPK